MSLRQTRDCFLVRFKPQFLYYAPRGTITEADDAILVARHEGFTIADEQQWPLHVNILRLKSELRQGTDQLHAGDCEIIALGEIIAREQDAWQIVRNTFEQDWRDERISYAR